jgi:hypothetical protein
MWAMKAKLCSSPELTSELLVIEEANPKRWQGWAIVEGPVGDEQEGHWLTQVLVQDKSGWNQWHQWSADPTWVHDEEMDEVARSNRCGGSVRNRKVRVMRPLNMEVGIPAVIVLERQRQ